MHHAAPLEGWLSDAATKAVNELLSSGAAGNLSSLCSWADKGTARTRRASRSAASLVPSTTTPPSSSPRDHHRHHHLLNFGQHNLTEVLLFLSNFMGDIHKPLHVGSSFVKEGNTINVH
ncbi:endonuclease 2-like [Aegilops tauschii subsp. strangulata]|uniref:endonuclease 2-like n=1 Tax=Aegilops tauschii subsp. strangulata TaxID=200361 RepID=UPI003CC86F6E